MNQNANDIPGLDVAVAHYRAPVSTLAELTSWSQRHLTVPARCGGRISPDHARIARLYAEPYQIYGGTVHTLRLDPYTMSTSVQCRHHTAHADTNAPDPATNEMTTQQQVAGEHFLWALTTPDIPNGCDWVSTLLSTVAARDRMRRTTRMSDWLLDRVLAARTVARAVTYLDAGLDLATHATLLRYGFPAEHAAQLHDAVTAGAITYADIDRADRTAHSAGSLPVLVATSDTYRALMNRILDPDHDAATDAIAALQSAARDRSWAMFRTII